MNKIMQAYDRLAELKKDCAANANAVRLIDALAERVEADDLDLRFVDWVGALLRGNGQERY